MRGKFAFALVAITIGASGALAGNAAAATGPSNECNGSLVRGIAATWPWAHEEEQTAFAPAPGAIALWLELFGPAVGVSSVRELQLLFC